MVGRCNTSVSAWVNTQGTAGRVESSRGGTKAVEQKPITEWEWSQSNKQQKDHDVTAADLSTCKAKRVQKGITYWPLGS